MKIIDAAGLQEKPIRWLWPDRIPLGVNTLIEGDPGTSKSTLTVCLAAHVSTGRDWPDGTKCEPGRVILANAEDPEQEIIKPRLVAAGANLSRISIISRSIDDTDDELFSIPTHIAYLEAAINKLDDLPVRLIVFDPLSSFLEGNVDDYRDHAIRRALRVVEKLAHNLQCTVCFVRHLNKQTHKAAIHRGGGSIGIIASVRSAFNIAPDPATKGRILMTNVKGNWTANNRVGMAYKVETVEYLNSAEESIVTSRVVWDGPVELDAEDVVRASSPEDNPDNLIEEAAAFVKDFLKDGPRDSLDLFHAAAKSGIKKSTIWTASKLLSLKRHSVDGVWIWELRNLTEDQLLGQFAGQQG